MNRLDVRLARQARAGDREAFAGLVDLYQDKLYHLALRMLSHPQEAEDAVQETFLRVFASLDRYDESQKFSTWIYRIATNLCIDRLRKRKSSVSLDADTADNGEGTDWYDVLPGDEQTPESRFLTSELQELVRKAIDELPDKYKAVVVLRYLHDMSLQEIGDILDLPVTTVKTRIHRGREALRRKLEAFGLLGFPPPVSVPEEAD
ncbi:MAG: RNA polymerase sigma factor SigW [Candidatus Reconcilbacillus cellulovorans]|uniref:RNA polymerase sigma factor SigW n=1 Tax=Candidatus Reconcilbacillus cellulovorans TaxID=1906605 RepID=A0A2A6DXQ5_9BACL|nr:MAG: RNA polymerase sigma factor SigW [Candidatus Reconcilbacillus cellulovorans]